MDAGVKVWNICSCGTLAVVGRWLLVAFWCLYEQFYLQGFRVPRFMGQFYFYHLLSPLFLASLPSQYPVGHLSSWSSMLLVLCGSILRGGGGEDTLCSCRIISLFTYFGNWLFSSPLYVKASLEMLTNKLRTLNGEIKDPRAAFMNRTKVC